MIGRSKRGASVAFLMLATALAAGCGPKAEDRTRSDISRRIANDTATHAGVVASAANVTFEELDFRNGKDSRKTTNAIRLRLSDATCLLVANPGGHIVLHELRVNGERVPPLKSNGIHYRFDQRAAEQWPALAFEQNPGCLPATTDDLKLTTLDGT